MEPSSPHSISQLPAQSKHEDEEELLCEDADEEELWLEEDEEE